MKTLFKILGAVAVLGALACGNQQDQGLDVSVTPSRPVMIPYGSGTTISNYFKLTPGYFQISSINLTWRGGNPLNVVAILLQSPDVIAGTSGGTDSVACNFAGDDLVTIYSTYNQANTGIVIPAPSPSATPVVVTGKPSGCGGITMPNPIPQTFNIPVRVKVVGAQLDATNNTIGRVTGTANIVIQ